MKSNPYFDPNPTWMYVTLRIWAGVGLFSSILGLFMIIFKSPSYNTLSFKCILFYYNFAGLMLQWHFCIFTPPLVYLPYFAVEFRGIYTAIGVHEDFQLSLLGALIIVAFAVTVPFFYHRMSCLLPSNHRLNSKYLRFFIYFTVYGILHICPIPVNLLGLQYGDRNEIKRIYEESYQLEMEGFWKKEVIAVMDNNPYAAPVIILSVLGIGIVITVPIFCTSVIYRTIVAGSQTLSEKMRKERMQSLVALITMMALLAGFAIIIGPFVVYIFLFRSPRCDLFNIMVVCVPGNYPLINFAYMLSYKPYRQAVIAIFKKRRVLTRISTVHISTTKGPKRRL